VRWIAIVLAASVAVGAASAAPRRPSIALVTERPLVVRGSGFQARERVRVAATAHRTRTVSTSRSGSFRVRLLPSWPAASCSALVLRARGARGELAVLKIRPMCPPA